MSVADGPIDKNTRADKPIKLKVSSQHKFVKLEIEFGYNLKNNKATSKGLNKSNRTGLTASNRKHKNILISPINSTCYLLC